MRDREDFAAHPPAPLSPLLPAGGIHTRGREAAPAAGGKLAAVPRRAGFPAFLRLLPSLSPSSSSSSSAPWVERTVQPGGAGSAAPPAARPAWPSASVPRRPRLWDAAGCRARALSSRWPGSTAAPPAAPSIVGASRCGHLAGRWVTPPPTYSHPISSGERCTKFRPTLSILRSGIAWHGVGTEQAAQGHRAAPEPAGLLQAAGGRPQQCFPCARLRAEISLPGLARHAWWGSGEGSGFSCAMARLGLEALGGRLCVGSPFSLLFTWRNSFHFTVAEHLACQATLPVQGNFCPGKWGACPWTGSRAEHEPGDRRRGGWAPYGHSFPLPSPSCLRGTGWNFFTFCLQTVTAKLEREIVKMRRQEWSLLFGGRGGWPWVSPPWLSHSSGSCKGSKRTLQ